MSGDFEIGDVVVCIDARPPRYKVYKAWHVSLNKLYRVTDLFDAPNGDPVVLVDGEPPHTNGFDITGWAVDRFRKIDAPRTEIADRIRACKPADNRVPA